MFIQLIVAFIATISIALLFDVPKIEFFYCGLTGGIGWVVYLLVYEGINSKVLATLAAALTVSFIARIFAVRRRLPVTIFLISGIFSLVPGAGIYYTTYYLLDNKFAEAFDKGVETISIAIAISFGIMIVFFIPQKLFLVLNNMRKREERKKWY